MGFRRGAGGPAHPVVVADGRGVLPLVVEVVVRRVCRRLTVLIWGIRLYEFRIILLNHRRGLHPPRHRPPPPPQPHRSCQNLTTSRSL